MAAPLDVSPVKSGSAPDVALAGSGPAEGRSLDQTAWGRPRHDKVAMNGAQYSLMIAFLVTFLAVGIGLFFRRHRRLLRRLAMQI